MTPQEKFDNDVAIYHWLYDHYGVVCDLDSEGNLFVKGQKTRSINYLLDNAVAGKELVERVSCYCLWLSVSNLYVWMIS